MAFYHGTTARVNTLPPPRILFSQSWELGIWLQIYFEQCLIYGVKSSFPSHNHPLFSSGTAYTYASEMRAQEEPEVQTQVLGMSGRWAGAGWGGCWRDCIGFLPGRAETKVLGNLVKSGYLRPNVATAGWDRGGSEGEENFSLETV